MKITIELTNLDEVKAVVAALENRNAQSVMALAPAPKAEAVAAAAEVKAEPKAAKAPKTKKAAEVEAHREAITDAKEEKEYVNENADTGVEIIESAAAEAGDIDDATMREVGGRLLRELNAKAKDGVGELTKILSSLGSKKVTEVPMNLRPRFVAKVSEALA